MSLAFAGIMIVIGLVSAIATAVVIPLFFGMVIRDVISMRDDRRVEKDNAPAIIAAERGVARAFVILGGAFWSVAAFAGLYSFRQTGMGAALMAALIPLVAIAATLIVGWYFERFTAAMLAVASVAIIAWGVIYQFELGVWLIMLVALIGPMMTASLLFWLARRDQEAYERTWAVQPELALVFAARSSLD